MKNYFLPRIFFLLLTLLSFSACSEDDDAPNDDDGGGSGNGNATYDGRTFNFTQGVVAEFGQGDEGVYNFDIDLLSDDFDIDFENEEINGRGEVLYFEMWTSQSSELKEGTYKLSNGESDFGITFADFSEDYNFNLDEGSLKEAVEAEVVLSRSGSIYSLDYTLNFADGKTLTGSFEGDLYEVTAD
ncbi:hypothetical protein [Christiangramia sediminis]|uniref:Uncharacterized protein n=1 Tax=Christiangramia sediminis TaxID=2881336 RepID=A0A9X1LJQ8_9FLAO|nr:hypothetical protein [Christiangramia sediminis]MCB7481560.1 hypothetical protein [Christiangramia sediminis]